MAKRGDGETWSATEHQASHPRGGASKSVARAQLRYLGTVIIGPAERRGPSDRSRPPDRHQRNPPQRRHPLPFLSEPRFADGTAFARVIVESPAPISPAGRKSRPIEVVTREHGLPVLPWRDACHRGREFAAPRQDSGPVPGDRDASPQIWLPGL
jgi:hypothetical protein